MTYSKYLNSQVKPCLHSTLKFLDKNKQARFIYAEVSYLQSWWSELTDSEKTTFKSLSPVSRPSQEDRRRGRPQVDGSDGSSSWRSTAPPDPHNNDQDFDQHNRALEAGTAEAAPGHAANAWPGSHTVVWEMP
ncbi:Alpha-mannosidase 2 [Sparganum proliferum]